MQANNILVCDYIELQKTEYETLTDKIITYISIIENADIEELYETDIDTLLVKYNLYKDIIYSLQNSPSKSIIELGEKKLKLINFNDIKFGQFIDLEYFISNDYYANLGKIASILYLKYEEKEFDNDIFESYNLVNLDTRSNYICNNIHIIDILSNINSYLKFRENIFKSYQFFETGLEDIDKDTLTEEELEIYEEEVAKLKNSSKDIWERILETVGNEDLTKYETILDTNLFLVFNRLQRIINNSHKKTS